MYQKIARYHGYAVTVGDANFLGGSRVTYSTGSQNFYVDAIVDPDLSLLCIDDAVSAGNIDFTPPGTSCSETNSLSFDEEDEDIAAEGPLTVVCGGRPGQGPGQGPGTDEQITAWMIEEEVLIPELNTLLEEAFEFETSELGGYDIEVEASVENLEFPTSDTTGGLTIKGIIKVYVPEPEEEE